MTAVTPAPEPTRTSLPAVAADLLLARLLAPSQKPPAPGKVQKELDRFFPRPLSEEEFRVMVNQLRASGQVAEKSLRLTESGRERALGFLGVKELPSRCNWQVIQSRYLVPKALGLAPDTAAARNKLGDKDKLAALLLKRRFNLPIATGDSLKNVLEALACRELGFPDLATLEEVKTAVLSRKVGADRRLTSAQLINLAPRVLLGVLRSDLAGLRELVLQGLGNSSGPGREKEDEGKDETHPRDRPFDLAAFAHTVKAAARDCPTGRFGDNKVFISHVWRRLADEPSFAGMDLETFKRRLVEANTNRLLTLSRADLVSVMNPADVRDSETHDLNAVFHFILIEREQP